MSGTEVTQSSKVSGMQIVQQVMSLMESSIGKLQYMDSYLYGLQKLDPRKSLKRVPLAANEYGAKRRRCYAFETDAAGPDAGAKPDFAEDFRLKRAPTVALDITAGYLDTVQENVVPVLSGYFH